MGKTQRYQSKLATLKRETGKFSLDVMPVLCVRVVTLALAMARPEVRTDSCFHFLVMILWGIITESQESYLADADLAYPAESLLVEKATEAVPHTGGKLFTKDSEYHDTLVSWLKAGAPDDPEDIATPTSLNIYPDQAVLEGKGRTQQFIAVAGYSDGTTRDVTSLTVFETNNALLQRSVRTVWLPQEIGGSICYGTFRYLHGWFASHCDSRRPKLSKTGICLNKLH